MQTEKHVIDYHKGHLQIGPMIQEQINDLPKDDLDALIDLTNGNSFIKADSGKIIKKLKFGPESWDLLIDTVSAGGEYIKLSSEGFWAARVYRLRSIFKDSESGYFFETCRNPYYLLRLNPERNIRIIMHT